MPLVTLEAARESLNRLRDGQVISPDNLFVLSGTCDTLLEDILMREQSAIFALQPRPVLSRWLQVLGLVLGTAGFATSIADYHAESGFSFWGWVGFAIGWVGLTVATLDYQLNAWERSDIAAELAEIRNWKAVLTEIIDEIERRLTVV